MNTDTHTSGSTVKNHISLKNGIRIQCYTEYFVPIVVPGVWTSSSSSLLSSTPMTPSRQEIDHPKSSSSSFTSTPMTSSTEIDHSDHPPAIVSSESVDRGDPYGMDHHPAAVSSESVERQELGDPYSSETSQELLNKPTKIPKPIKMRITSENGKTRVIPTYRNGCKNAERILWMKEFLNTETHTRLLLMNHLQSLREEWIWVNTVFTLTSWRLKFRYLPEDHNHKGPVQKTYWSPTFVQPTEKTTDCRIPHHRRHAKQTTKGQDKTAKHVRVFFSMKMRGTFGKMLSFTVASHNYFFPLGPLFSPFTPL